MTDYTEREPEPLLRVPGDVPADYWLAGYKAGYLDTRPAPPRGAAHAELYWKGYGEGAADKAKQQARAAAFGC